MIMSDLSNQAKSIFLAAIEEHAPEQWPAFLDQACAGDLRLRAEVEKLLRSRSEMGSFHEPPPAPLTTVDAPVIGERPGTAIGPYKLIEQIGEGGMGTVYMAEQTAPVQRLVALKVIKAGMDSRQVLARFEAERQALALMDHPNIAKVLDAGATDSGRPYFVMELVKGIPITQFCDERRLTPRERLELFIPVCQAVQHAHHKGIIHRDIKPSNVLIAPYDGKPVVKVIDFGVAKATGQRLTEKSLFTDFGAVVGTLEYMSPEQAELNNQDIDTRSDIYSLGVLLYELLAGTTPLDRKRLKEAAVIELLRVIRDVEPPRPSTRLSNSKDSLPTISAQRQMEPAKLTKLVRGELDWIVMKALEKHRNRRYETATGLASDIEHYLRDEPVTACPPSLPYRLRKFARRHKAAVAMVSLAAIALTALGAAGLLAYRNRLVIEQHQAELNSHERRLLAEKRQNALEKALMAAMSGDFADAEKSIDDAELLGASTGQVRMLRGHVAFHRGDEAKAIEHLEQAVQLIPAGETGAVAARAMLAITYLNSFEFTRFVALSSKLDPLAPITPDDFLFKGLLETSLHPERGMQMLDEGVRRHDSVLARATRLEARANRALITGKIEDAELALEDAQVAQRMLAGNALILARNVFAHLVAAGVYQTKGRPQDSERLLEEARPLAKELEQFAATPFAAKACFEFYEYVGDEEAAYAMSRRGNQFRRAVMLYRRGEYDKALESAVERSRSGTVGPTEQIERGLILPELADGLARARGAFDEIKADRRGNWQVVPPLILLLLGKAEDARQASLQVRREEVLPWGDGWWLTLVDFNCGRITAEQLLQAGGDNRMRLSDVYFVIGMRRLANGDRTAAQEQFRKCVATRVFCSWHWPWARAFLTRMQKDPAWPSWIPKRGNGPDHTEVSELERSARASVPR
jgi:serine/threonine protein kinase/tetratricopeptide (TPR) repeat protein